MRNHIDIIEGWLTRLRDAWNNDPWERIHDGGDYDLAFRLTKGWVDDEEMEALAAALPPKE